MTPVSLVRTDGMLTGPRRARHGAGAASFRASCTSLIFSSPAPSTSYTKSFAAPPSSMFMSTKDGRADAAVVEKAPVAEPGFRMYRSSYLKSWGV